MGGRAAGGSGGSDGRRMRLRGLVLVRMRVRGTRHARCFANATAAIFPRSLSNAAIFLRRICHCSLSIAAYPLHTMIP